VPVLVIGASLATPAAAGDGAPVRELGVGDVTPQGIVEVLEPKGPPPGRPRSLTRPELTCRAYEEASSRGLVVKPATDVVALQIHFAPDSSELSPDSRSVADAIGKALSSPKLELSCFRIEGHTDADGPDEHNRQLSERRAQAVRTYLVEKHEIAPDRLLAVGYGEERALADNDTAGGKQRNRRVQIANLGYADEKGD
jgi:outer membrane protein OmpA-like peptidoglycan-associated protein